MSSFTIDEICTISRTERGAWGKVFIKIGNETYTYNFSYMSLELTTKKSIVGDVRPNKNLFYKI